MLKTDLYSAIKSEDSEALFISLSVCLFLCLLLLYFAVLSALQGEQTSIYHSCFVHLFLHYFTYVRVRRRSCRTFSTHIEIFRRRFDGVVIYFFFDSDFKFFDDEAEFSVTSLCVVFLSSKFTSVFLQVRFLQGIQTK